ncbi:hypothetical protein [Paenibacillus polymyxa]|uniref:hypothetical protein n=1 Tax=Paenibacillus polymyxa TaxID=1406 RepID=UPI002378A896|nr:hypothetical protein [Paenibacillus polymyxa]WDM23827.1 hypothetical protein J4I02_10225 [Paenibacillus polymyxa]
MSVFVAAIHDGGKRIDTAADSRVCLIGNGEYWHCHDDGEKLQKFEGFVAYISGAMALAEEVSKILKESPVRTIDQVVSISKSVYRKHTENYPPLRDMKYILQVVIPLKDDGRWCLCYFDDQNGFEPEIYGAHEGEDYVFAIGKGGKVVQPYVESKLGTMNMTDLFVEAFEEAASISCGGKLTHYVLCDDGLKEEYYREIRDKEVYRKMPSNMNLHAEGDGVTATSAVGFLRKPKGSFDYEYFSSNNDRPRKISLNDEGISIISELGQFTATSKDFTFIAKQGSYKIGLSNGSTFELSPEGIKADIVGSVSIKSSKGMKFDAPRYDFI